MIKKLFLMLWRTSPLYCLLTIIEDVIDTTDTRLFDPRAMSLSRKELDEILEQEKKRLTE